MARARRRTEEIRSRKNDSVTTSGDGRPELSGKSITRRAEDYAKEEHEPGRVGDKSTARYVTGIGSETMNPVDKKSPNLR
jgi:hypothetical protein